VRRRGEHRNHARPSEHGGARGCSHVDDWHGAVIPLAYSFASSCSSLTSSSRSTPGVQYTVGSRFDLPSLPPCAPVCDILRLSCPHTCVHWWRVVRMRSHRRLTNDQAAESAAWRRDCAVSRENARRQHLAGIHRRGADICLMLVLGKSVSQGQSTEAVARYRMCA
jgi:hypothetical protein